MSDGDWDWGRRELIASLMESVVRSTKEIADAEVPTVKKSTFAGFAQEGEKWFLVSGLVEITVEACEKPKGT